MHARHRSPGNGYRSGSMGMGLSASRISPEGSLRGHGFYNSEHRSFNRGFGRGQGQPKSFQATPTATRKSGGDIFMEAGRLAAEYLVSQGLLPPSVLSGKWQNGMLKKQAGDFQDFRSQDGENFHLPPDGRPSALSRLGSSSDVGLGKRRYSDNSSSTASRSHLKGRRKGGSFRYDFGREYGRSGSWSDRSRVSPEMEGDDDTISGHDEQPVDKDVGNGLQKSGSDEFAPKSEEAGDSESELDKYSSQDGLQSQVGSSSAGRDGMHDGEVSKKSNAATGLMAGTGELKNFSNDDEMNQTALNGSFIQHSSQEGDSSGKNSTDLLKLCKFAKVPTKTRSSLTSKGPKFDSVSNNEGSTFDIRPPKGFEILVEDDPSGHSSLGGLLSNKIHDFKGSQSEKSGQSLEYARDLGTVSSVERGKCRRSQSFPDGVLLRDNEQESCQDMPGLQRSSSMVQETGEKRAVEENDLREETKPQREWLPSVASKAEECFDFSNISGNKMSSKEERVLPGEKVMAVDRESLVSNSQFPMVTGEPGVRDAQEKQLFPSSFKICDLNLVGTSDMNENNHSDPMLLFPAIVETKKEAGPVDVDLSMSSTSKAGEYCMRASNGKEIEIIDLENDSIEELNARDNVERKQQAGFMSFSSHPQNAGDIPDVPDYNEGLMMAELLNSLANLPQVAPGINPVPEDINHVPQDVNPLPNEMGLHGGQGMLSDDQGTLGDDDSIYMSLGEIPLSFLRAWEQPPPQEYEKPF